MSDRKYRQRGYQDDDNRNRSTPAARRPPEPRDPRLPRDPKTPNMPGFREVARCSRCGALVDAQIFSRSKCGKCGQDLRSCAQCVHFDPGARLECTQPIVARVSPKDVVNDCTFFSPRTSWERETSSVVASKPTEPSGAKKAFDDLFKF